ncbi:hypothetical protein SAMN05428979_0151 [Stappia sp. ES.058]|nr:hypothetical protein SAMN05428979_0151 [Stappia sp. ES.058]
MQNGEGRFFLSGFGFFGCLDLRLAALENVFFRDMAAPEVH